MNFLDKEWINFVDVELENINIIQKELYVIITAEGGFSGDIDQKLVKLMLETYDAEKNDIIVIGHHGALQLAQRGVSYKKYFKLPNKDVNINVKALKWFKSSKWQLTEL